MYTDLVAQLPSLWEQFARVGDALWLLLRFSPYWGPPVLAVSFWHVWIRYVRSRFIADQENVLLELRLPAEVMKSPAAMQAVFDGLWQKLGETSFIDRIWVGKVRMWYSFELVSTEGQVHMYIWVRSAFRLWAERTFYAHYPDIEIVEVEDYATALPYNLETYNSWGCDFRLDEAVGVPLRTYIDYHLDQTSTKEEQKVDPITHVFEYLGSLGKGEHAWIQILARANKREDMTYGHMRNRKSYGDLAKEEVTRIRKTPEQKIIFPDGGEGYALSDEQLQRIKAISRVGSGGTHWDVGIRGIYIAEHEYFTGTNIPGMIAMWQPFGSSGHNAIKLDPSRWQAMFDYPWQDFNDFRQNRKKVQIIDAYRRRSWFHAPYRFKHFMLTSEELATLFHIPGTVAKTPTLQRIDSARGQAPSNLPT